jgi:hypothetical protein
MGEKGTTISRFILTRASFILNWRLKLALWAWDQDKVYIDLEAKVGPVGLRPGQGVYWPGG